MAMSLADAVPLIATTTKANDVKPIPANQAVPPALQQKHVEPRLEADETGLIYVQYSTEKEEQYLPAIRALISKDLSEPYSIYVYRYFLNQWPHLCFMGLDPLAPHPLHAIIISKLEPHPPVHASEQTDEPRPRTLRGYIAMLAVDSSHRRRGIASRMISLSIDSMKDLKADEVMLETETSNQASLRLYESLGFIRTKKLHRYYLNGNTAYRLGLFLRPGAGTRIMGGSMMAPYEMDVGQKSLLAPNCEAEQKENAEEAAEELDGVTGGGGLSMRFPGGPIS